MSARVWRTGEPRDASFDAAWNAALDRAPFAHFALRLDWMEWGHAHGTPSIAVLAEEDGRTGLIAARREKGVWVSGLPWRWQAAMCGPDRPVEPLLTAAECAWLFRALERGARGRRVRAFLPQPPASGVIGYLGGKTLLHRVDVSDEDLQGAMDKTKRAMIRRAQRGGYEVVRTLDLDRLREFSAVQRATDERHGKAPLDHEADALPAPGERWREWELPWMDLLLAIQDGRVRSGFGFALGSGAVLESRAAGSTREALRDGAFVLLAFEAARRARELGYRYLNWGGDTFFKRDVVGPLGVPVPLYCWLGGAVAWAPANQFEAGLHRARRVASRLKGATAEPGEDGLAAPPKPKRTAPSASRMLVSLWRTQAPLDPAFAAQWERRVMGAPHANFTLDLRYLTHEAAAGRHSMAILAEEGGYRVAFALRESGGELVSGWPWRWQVVLEGRSEQLATPLDAAACEWLHGVARRVTHERRVRLYLPSPSAGGAPSYPAGATILQPLDRSDDEVLAAMSNSKRRMVRRARELGYEIEDAAGEEAFREYAALQREAAARRGFATVGAAEEAWREWQLPWMWLLVARRDGRIVSGAGDGVCGGGTVEGRAGASSDQARRDGAFALVCFEEVRRARDRGYRWLNHCGDTMFKREMTGKLGVRVPMWCWLSGGRLHGAFDRGEAFLRSLRPRAAAILRTRGPLQSAWIAASGLLGAIDPGDLARWP